MGGYTMITEQDDCASGTYSYQEKYYLAFRGYRLKNTADFHTAKGRYFLTSMAWSKNANGSLRMDRVPREIPVRYVFKSHDGMLLFPLSAQQFKLAKTLTYTVAGIVIILLAFAILILPVRILYFIARGNAFHPTNIRHLRFIGWILIGLFLVPNIVALIFNLIVSSHIPEEIYLPIVPTLLGNSWLLVAGLTILLIRMAFKKGHEASQIHEFTY
jgi:hypothetical protein